MVHATLEKANSFLNAHFSSSLDDMVKPEDVLALTAPTQDFLCPFEANTYGIEFLSFRIQDGSSEDGPVLFEVSKDPNEPAPQLPPNFDKNRLRMIAYRFPAAFLLLRSIHTNLVFRVGNNEVNGFRMIERHYFRDRLIRSYDFNFHFCIPNSTNTWDATYDLPELTMAEMQEMVAHPNESRSDSFYCVGDQLVMHNKASYSYDPTLQMQ